MANKNRQKRLRQRKFCDIMQLLKYEGGITLKKRLGLLCLVFVLISSSFYGVSAEDQEQFATRGKVLEMILNAADSYHEDLQPSDIMKGDEDGNLRENDPVLRVEAMAMLSRAFPDLAAPSEYQYSIGNFGITFTDLPQWAQGDLSNLTRAGIIAGYPDGRLGVNDNVTEEQMTLLIRRIWAYLGNNLKDDFYASYHKSWLDSATLSASDLVVGTFQQVEDQTSRQLDGIIEDMVEGNWQEDSREQRVKSFYLSAMDMDSRNKQGIQPVEHLLSSYDDVESLQELLQAHAIACDEIGESNILGIEVEIDYKNGTNFVPYVYGMAGILEKSYFTSEDEGAKQAYLDYVSALLEIGGETEDQARKHAEQLYEMEREVTLASLDPQEYDDLDQSYSRYTSYDFYNLFQDVSPRELVDSWDKAGFFILYDEGRVLKTIDYLKDEYLEELKTYMKFWLLQGCSSLLGEEFQQPYADFVEALYGIEVQFDQEQQAAQLVKSYLPGSLEQDYAEQYCSPEIKEDVTELTQDLRKAFRKRLEKNEWLSTETRKKAIQKLSSMIINVAYPDDFYYDSFDGVSFNKDLFSNAMLIRKESYSLSKKMIGKEADHSAWPMTCYTVNAAYVPNFNSITIPAGILQAPFYDGQTDMEKNLGGIGVIIAHEISHAFDATGAKYDKDGWYYNWWTDQDFRKFQEKCNKVEAFYDGWEISNHAKCNGKLTLSENIADLSGMACALDVMKTLDQPDYQLFFENYAEVWKEYGRTEYVNDLAENDVHAPGSLRVNRVVVNFQEFYDAYQIQPGDGMYVPPEERVTIW